MDIGTDTQPDATALLVDRKLKALVAGPLVVGFQQVLQIKRLQEGMVVLQLELLFQCLQKILV